MNNILVTLNADGRSISKSETFILSHIHELSQHFNVITLVGNPLKRKNLDNDEELFSQSFISKLLRKFYRTITGISALEQDNRVLIKFINRNNIKVVFSEYGMSGASVLNACKDSNTPLIVHFHGYDAYRKDIVDKYRKQYSEMFKYASSIICVSKDMKNFLFEMFGENEKLIHNSCGADFSKIQGLNTDEKDDRSIVFAGRLTPKKDPLGLIKSFNDVLKYSPDAKLTVIGSGELEKDCEEYIRFNHLEENVKLLGWLSHDDTLEQVRKSKIFVMNSVTSDQGDKEGTPVALMEAMALENIPIATRHGGIPDIVSHEITGCLYEERDYSELTRLLVNALKGDYDDIPKRAKTFASKNLGADNKNRVLSELVFSAVNSER